MKNNTNETANDILIMPDDNNKNKNKNNSNNVLIMPNDNSNNNNSDNVLIMPYDNDNTNINNSNDKRNEIIKIAKEGGIYEGIIGCVIN